MLLPLSLVWAIEPMAFQVLLQQIRAVMPRLDVSAGPTEDAERSGLPITKVGSTAMITLKGPMIKEASWLSQYFGIASTRGVQQAIQSALADDDVEKILLYTDSPGGSVDGLAELGDTIAEAVKVKDVIAQVSGMVASAAYYAISQATEIRAGRMDLVGSIGTRMMFYDFSKAYEDAGIEAVPIDTGEFKSAGVMGAAITEAQRKEFQRIVDGYFTDFKAMVINGRGIAAKQLDSYADGRMFFAKEAVEMGLIDKISTIENTIHELRQNARPKGRSTQAARALVEQQAALLT